MHAEAYSYVAHWATQDPISVVELGARETWGPRLRDLFPNANYVGVDACAGPGVDVIANAVAWQPDDPVDLVLCCEVFEHTPRWADIVANAATMLRPGGRLIVTCAGPGRKVHGVGHDDVDRPGYYENVDFNDLAAVMRQHLTRVRAREVPHRSSHLGGTDTYATGVRE